MAWLRRSRSLGGGGGWGPSGGGGGSDRVGEATSLGRIKPRDGGGQPVAGLGGAESVLVEVAGKLMRREGNLAATLTPRAGSINELPWLWVWSVAKDAAVPVGRSSSQRIARDLKLEVVPALFNVGYSNNMLWHDPNLAEGLPVRGALFEVRGGEAHLVPDPQVSFGERFDWKDDSVHLEGGIAAASDFEGNARLVKKLKVSPFRAYQVSVRVRTEDFTGEPRIQALAGERALIHSSLGVKRTQDWTEHQTAATARSSPVTMTVRCIK